MRAAAILIAAGAFLTFWITLIAAEVHASDETGTRPGIESGQP